MTDKLINTEFLEIKQHLSIDKKLSSLFEQDKLRTPIKSL